MVIELVKPQNALKVFAGLTALFFEKISGPRSEENGTAVAIVVASEAAQADDLTQINGVGPTFARRLQEAGVDSFAKLAVLSPEQVKEITRLKDWQGEPEEWIAQAKIMA